jgi:hypothetical protein
MSVKYIHLRRWKNGEPLPHGGATIAYYIDETDTAHYSIAECSDKDNFNRKIGRNVADGRLFGPKKKEHLLYLGNNLLHPVTQIVKEVTKE